MRAFESSDHAPGFKDIDLGTDRPPKQRSLGLRWNLSADAFSFQINCADKPLTKHDILLVVNSLYDPLGFVAPITIQDHVGFVFGKAKLAPKPDHTIPRLELCGTVLAVELADFIQHELDTHIDDVQYYSDSKVVLGYIYNQTRRFYVYVSNRIERKRRSSKPEQWQYIPSELNPADHATRAMSINSFANSSWLSGPKFLLEQKGSECAQEVFSIQDADDDPEVRSEVSALATNAKPTSTLSCQRFERFSNWMKLVKTISRLLDFISRTLI
ncbi:uncharacterized protein LOC143782202 [Ranitomeya variabilis]|uniref:uncharacterized protein LOC143782202 n=1 Tax=Ranitomeya variabilis TaxID=490064 RepID=UPI004057B34D